MLPHLLIQLLIYLLLIGLLLRIVEIIDLRLLQFSKLTESLLELLLIDYFSRTSTFCCFSYDLPILGCYCYELAVVDGLQGIAEGKVTFFQDLISNADF